AMFGILTVFVALIAVYVYKYYENVRRYPRGPTPFPLIGNLHKIDPRYLHFFLEESQKEFGDVFTIWTPAPMVVLMSYDTIKEALVTKGDAFAGRSGRFPDNLFMTTENGGVIFSQGDNWREQRRTAIHILRDFGMGSNVMEAQVKSSMHEFMRNLDNIEDKSRVEFRWPLQVLVANVVNEVLFGYHYKYDDCKRLMDYSQQLNTQSNKRNPLMFLIMSFPFLSKVPIIGWLGEGQFRASTAKLTDHVREDVDKCEKTYDANEEPSCFVHAYMQRMEKNGGYLSKDQMLNVCSDFFLAGMETTSTTLRWAVLHMANNLDVQEKIRAEIHSIIGRDGEISMADRVRLPFTAAAVTEIQRISNILPVNIVHRTVTDTEVAGHFLPENTLIIAQISNVLKQESVFERPKEFRPQRFLMEDGKTPNKAALDQAIPFSMGKRACAGESLARMELFLGLAMILQKYRILPPKDAPIDFKPQPGFVSIPHANYLQMIED
ncbi:hypothetical protein PFISCL1PPCAC_7216, partial [Pristionchus fissidentatus]